MKNPFCIKISCPRIVDRRSSSRQDLRPGAELRAAVVLGIRDSPRAPSRATSRTSGTSGPWIARDPDPRTALILLGFELTDLSRIVLLQAIVPESCRSQASCQCGNA
ncbi:PREDICTED: uncharacterized protein LOC108556062 [Eufriesea mexicana]|uniref:uncharacterized protein LOC108556062 n=1 Tax=Eufriesea mexicana TaxID=516756 RepID=UPI00083C0F59|nr:PREDICTED: uncharacterized protein LOC108556062 [Eufriesea mexicana]